MPLGSASAVRSGKRHGQDKASTTQGSRKDTTNGALLTVPSRNTGYGSEHSEGSSGGGGGAGGALAGVTRDNMLDLPSGGTLDSPRSIEAPVQRPRSATFTSRMKAFFLNTFVRHRRTTTGFSNADRGTSTVAASKSAPVVAFKKEEEGVLIYKVEGGLSIASKKLAGMYKSGDWHEKRRVFKRTDGAFSIFWGGARNKGWWISTGTGVVGTTTVGVIAFNPMDVKDPPANGWMCLGSSRGMTKKDTLKVTFFRAMEGPKKKQKNSTANRFFVRFNTQSTLLSSDTGSSVGRMLKVLTSGSAATASSSSSVTAPEVSRNSTESCEVMDDVSSIEDAATTIQHAVRRRHTKKVQGATTIQRHWRERVDRISQQRQQEEEHRTAAALAYESLRRDEDVTSSRSISKASSKSGYSQASRRRDGRSDSATSNSPGRKKSGERKVNRKGSKERDEIRRLGSDDKLSQVNEDNTRVIQKQGSTDTREGRKTDGMLASNSGNRDSSSESKSRRRNSKMGMARSRSNSGDKDKRRDNYEDSDPGKQERRSTKEKQQPQRYADIRKKKMSQMISRDDDVEKASARELKKRGDSSNSTAATTFSNSLPPDEGLPDSLPPDKCSQPKAPIAVKLKSRAGVDSQSMTKKISSKPTSSKGKVPKKKKEGEKEKEKALLVDNALPE